MGQTYHNLFMVARSERRGGGGEDDVTGFDEIEHSSAVHGTIHSQPFFKETKKWQSEKQPVVI